MSGDGDGDRAERHMREHMEEYIAIFEERFTGFMDETIELVLTRRFTRGQFKCSLGAASVRDSRGRRNLRGSPLGETKPELSSTSGGPRTWGEGLDRCGRPGRTPVGRSCQSLDNGGVGRTTALAHGLEAEPATRTFELV